MLGLKSTAYNINNTGSGQFEFFSDISTRSLQTVRVGESAGKISRGGGNAFIGFETGKENLDGSFGVFVGFQAGSLNQYGNFNTYVGAFSGKYNERGDRNTFVGYKSGELNKDGSDCTAVGVESLQENTTGNKNVAVGTRSGQRILDGDNNTMIGMEAGQDIRSGNNNTMAGYRSGRAAFKGNENTYFGALAGYSNSLGDGNSFVGYQAGEYLTSGDYNVAVGLQALQKLENGSCNIAIGAFSGSSAGGSGNVLIGTNAATSNTGNDNTVIGSGSASESQGDDNVYIGTRAANSLEGYKNVVIGVDAMKNDTTSGSVVIGYGAANETFRSGVSNIFIGVGADAYLQEVSHAIAIGSDNTLANDNTISIGEAINNAGGKSVIVGYTVDSDANQSVSLGNRLTVNSVDVFNDLINYLFPVNQIGTYNSFGFRESYCNMLYLYGVSNETGIATIQNSNIYDSGLNTISGITQQNNLILKDLFDYNISYNNSNISVTSNLSFNVNLDNTSNLVTVDSLLSDTFILIPSNQLFNADELTTTNIAEATKTVLLDASSIISSNESIASNLIPTDNGIFKFIYAITKRNRLSNVMIENDYIINDTTTDYIFRNNSPLFEIQTGLYNDIHSNEISINTIPDIPNVGVTTYNREWYVFQQPEYGYITPSVTQSTDTVSEQIGYKLYPEALYASSDTFKITVLNRIYNYSSTDSNVYGIIENDNNILSQNIYINSNQELHTSCNIYIHPNTTTKFDRSYLRLVPYHTIDSSNIIDIISFDDNIKLTFDGIEYTSNQLANNPNLLKNIQYDYFTSNSFEFRAIDINDYITEPLILQYNSNEYQYSYNYNSNIQIYSESNITIYLESFQLNTPTTIPLQGSNIYIEEYPKYGNITVPSSFGGTFEYTPVFLNFDEGDSFSVILQENYYTHSRYEVNVVYDTTSYGKVPSLFKMQENITSVESLSYNIYDSNLSLNNYFNTVINSNIIITGEPNDSNRYDNYYFDIINTTNYDHTKGGYPYQSNIFIHELYSNVSSNDLDPVAFGLIELPLSNIDYGSNELGYIYRDFIQYLYPPYEEFRAKKWDYSQDGGVIDSSNVYDVSYGCNILTAETGFILSNIIPIDQEGSNRYFYLEQFNIYNTIYKYGCNTYIFNSNLYTSEDDYYDIYNTYIYTCNYTRNDVDTTISTSNYEYIAEAFTDVPTYDFNNYDVNTHRFITSNIPTIELQNSYLYQKDRVYNIVSKSSVDILVLQKNIGEVTTFYQSNINEKEIHIWNKTNENAIHIITFDDTSNITLEYFQNSVAAPSLSGIPSCQFINGVPTNIQIPTVTNGDVYIQHTSNIMFRNASDIKLKLDYAEITSSIYAIADEQYSNVAVIDYIIKDTGTTYRPEQLLITDLTYIRNTSNNLNIGILHKDRNTQQYITSNELYYQTNSELYSDITYTITSISDIELYNNGTPITVSGTFTQDDINNNRIYVNYGVYDYISTEFFDYTVDGYSSTFYTQKYFTTNFLDSSYSNTSCNVILQVGNVHNQLMLGDIWDQIVTGYSINSSLRDVNMIITKTPERGYLVSSNELQDTYTSNNSLFTYNQLLNDKIYYIPYEPMGLSNDSMEIYLEYSNVISPVYTVPLKNYWSRWDDIIVPFNNERFYDTSFYSAANSVSYATSNLLRSFGMIEDNITWEPEYVYVNNPNFENKTTSVQLQLPGLITFNTDITSVPITQRPYFTTTSITLNVSNGNYLYLTDILQLINNTSQNVIFYMTGYPSQGHVVTNIDNQYFEVLPYFTSQDISNKKVFYQHNGTSTNIADSFKLKVATSPYSVSITELTVNINVTNSSRLVTNELEYVFHESMYDGSNEYNLLQTDKIQLTTGYFNFYNNSNIEFYHKVGETYNIETTFSKTQLDNGEVYYRILPSFFSSGSNEDTIISTNITTNGDNESIDTNPLSVFPIYTNIYEQEWNVKYNTYESSNIILDREISSNQVISYKRNLNTSNQVSFVNKKCRIEFEYLPNLPPLNDTIVYEQFNKNHLSDVNTYNYTFEIFDINYDSLLLVNFSNSNISVYKNGSNQVLEIEKTSENENSLFRMENINYRTFYILNEDERNSYNLSLYIDNINYMNGLGITSLDLENIYEINITVPIYDELNYEPYYVRQKELNDGSKIYYDIIEYNTKINIRNFKILLSTTEINKETFNVTLNDDIFNVSVGHRLDINGTNNICIGKNFKTTGKGSIILGSDIGTQVSSTGEILATFNEIFNSIIITNTSFTNSAVRDVIAIGNNILNNAGGAISEFLAKKPVLIGNDIDITKIDFNINIQNTFVKTTVGSEQIYIGLEGEYVGIGYTENMVFTNSDYVLNVNGGANINGGAEIKGKTVIKDGNLTTGTLTHKISDITSNIILDPQLVVSDNETGQSRLYLGSYYTSGIDNVGVIQSSDTYSGLDHSSKLLLNPRGGNVGVGTTNPQATLHINGTFYSPGCIVQVQYAETSATRYTISSQNIDDIPGLSISFTPKFITSKLLLVAMINSSATYVSTFGFRKDGTNMISSTDANNTNSTGSISTTYDVEIAASVMHNMTIQYMHTPNSLDSATYTVAACSSWAGTLYTLYINDRSTNDMRSISNFTIYEIAQ